uniref:Uncharacterized protein n=1 Tax=Ditylenchus dipsaci TaxID=166011 RepID=A0A915DB21_9BILA
MSSSRSLVCLFALIAGVMVLGRPQGPPDGQFPGMPAELEAILPAETVTQLKAVHADPSLGFQQKQEQIDKLWSNCP